jgi:hypothetical protein
MGEWELSTLLLSLLDSALCRYTKVVSGLLLLLPLGRHRVKMPGK